MRIFRLHSTILTGGQILIIGLMFRTDSLLNIALEMKIRLRQILYLMRAI
jgi:hypothetical protein